MVLKSYIRDDMARLISRTDTVSDPDGCWYFNGKPSEWGYGSFTLNGKSIGAHRAAYQIFCGPTSEGMDVDHICHTRENCHGGTTCKHRLCVRPSHLQLITHHENVLRGHAAVTKRTKKDVCFRGHEYTSENTYTWFNKKLNRDTRGCKACRAYVQRQCTIRRNQRKSAT